MTEALLTVLAYFTWGVGLAALAALEVWLLGTGRPSLSERVWGGNWPLGLAVVGWLAWGPCFTAAHFWLNVFRPR